MKKYLSLILFAVSIATSFAQKSEVDSILKNQYSEKDTIPRVLYSQATEKLYEKTPPVYFVDGICYISSSALNALDPEAIESIYVYSNDTIVKGEKYHGKIYIKIKPGFNPRIITVEKLISKYVKLKGKNYFFSIDGVVINENENSVYVDEKRVMQINVVCLDKIKNPKDIYFISIQNRTAEKVKNANAVKIRGNKL